MSVGLMYKLDAVECGTHSWSIATRRLMHLVSSSPSKFGSTTRDAVLFIRAMF